MQLLLTQIGFIITILLSIGSCERQQNTVYQDFIRAYGSDAFNEFIGFSVYYRGSDNEGNLLYFANLDGDDCESPLIIRLDEATKQFKAFDFSLVEMHCKNALLDSVKMKSLTLAFLEYEIPYLQVTSDSIVQVGTRVMQRPDLFRFSASSLSEDSSGFQHLSGRWYIKK